MKASDFEILEFRGNGQLTITISDGQKEHHVCADIMKVKRLRDGRIFEANPTVKQKTRNLSFYVLGFWFNDSLRTINVCGKYTKKDSCLSVNICCLNDLL